MILHILLVITMRKLLCLPLVHHILPLLLLCNQMMVTNPVYLLICERHKFASTGINVPAGEDELNPGRERKGRHLVSGYVRSFERVEVGG